MRFSWFALLLFVGICSNIDAEKTYSRHQLWRLNIKNIQQLSKIIEFSRIAHRHDINFWSDEFRINVPVSVLICSMMNRLFE